MLVSAQLERKVSLVSLGLKVFLVVLVSLGLVMLEHLASEEILESRVYQVYLDSRVYQDQEVSKACMCGGVWVCVCVCVCVCVFERGRGLTGETHRSFYLEVAFFKIV